MDVNKNCPECSCEYNNTTHRNVKESCGHNKCRQCLIFADTGCNQCSKDKILYSLVPENKTIDCDVKLPKLIDINVLSLPSPCKIKSEWAKLASESKKSVDDIDTAVFTYDFVDESNTEPIENYLKDGIVIDISSIKESNSDELKDVPNTSGVGIVDDTSIDHVPVSNSKSIIILENKIIRPATKNVETPNKTRKKKEKIAQSTKKIYKKFIAPKYLELKKVKDPKTGKFNEHYFCNICNKQLRSMQQKRYHLYCDKTEKKPFPCNECDKEFVTKYHLDYHMESHKLKKSYNCEFCNKEFARRISLQNHKRGHSADYQFKCDKCNKKYAKQHQLKEHKLKHTNCPPHKCIKCDKTFYMKSNLNKHMVSHSGDKKFVCSTCGMKFPRNNALKTHTLIHKPKRYHECSKCMRRFVDQKNLDRHIKTHLDFKEFECPICPIKSSRRDNFIRHMKNIHPSYNLKELKDTLREKNIKLKTDNKIPDRNISNAEDQHIEERDVDTVIIDEPLEANSEKTFQEEVKETEEYYDLPEDEPKYVGVIKSVGNAKPVRLLYKHNKSINLFKSAPENLEADDIITETNITTHKPIILDKIKEVINKKEVKRVEHQALDQNIAAQIELNLQHNNKGLNKFRNDYDDSEMNCRKRSQSNIEIYKRILTPYTNTNDKNNIKRTYSNDFSNKISTEHNNTNKQNNRNEKVSKKFDPIEIYRKILLPSQDDDSSTNYDLNDNDNDIPIDNDDNNLDNTNKHLNNIHENNFSEMHWRKRTSQCFLFK